MENKKSWFRKHWILTIFLSIISLLIALPLIIGFFFGVTGTSVPQSMKDVWSKNSSYTVEECNKVCDTVYDLQINADTCQSSCESIYGKPSDSLDKFVNSIKEIKYKKQNSSS
jgi:hypothetical protein